jgi:hypothetical protein
MLCSPNCLYSEYHDNLLSNILFIFSGAKEKLLGRTYRKATGTY